jgi:hypothetical protein
MSPQMKSLQDVRLLAGAELSRNARLGYVALLLVSAAMTAVISSLWLTEVALPVRTQWAFGVMSLIGVSWMALSLWTLNARRPLFARDRVIAGGMAVAFTSLFFAGAAAAVVIASNAASLALLSMGALMLACAVSVFVGARRRFADLSARRAALAAR